MKQSKFNPTSAVAVAIASTAVKNKGCVMYDMAVGQAAAEKVIDEHRVKNSKQIAECEKNYSAIKDELQKCEVIALAYSRRQESIRKDFEKCIKTIAKECGIPAKLLDNRGQLVPKKILAEYRSAEEARPLLDAYNTKYVPKMQAVSLAITSQGEPTKTEEAAINRYNVLAKQSNTIRARIKELEGF